MEENNKLTKEQEEKFKEFLEKRKNSCCCCNAKKLKEEDLDKVQGGFDQKSEIKCDGNPDIYCLSHWYNGVTCECDYRNAGIEGYGCCMDGNCEPWAKENRCPNGKRYWRVKK